MWVRASCIIAAFASASASASAASVTLPLPLPIESSRSLVGVLQAGGLLVGSLQHAGQGGASHPASSVGDGVEEGVSNLGTGVLVGVQFAGSVRTNLPIQPGAVR